MNIKHLFFGISTLFFLVFGLLGCVKPTITPKVDIFVSSTILPDAGSCVGFDFPLQSDGIHTNTSWPLRVLRHKAPIYNKGKIIKTLKFGDVLDVIKIRHDTRIQVKETDSDIPLGWMERHDLLCTVSPLVDNKGLERKVFLKNNDVIVYHKTCQDCIKPSSLQMYFIMAETTREKQKQYYLISEKQNIITSPPLVGWVEKNQVFHLKTALQVRPQENVIEVVAYSNLNKPKENNIFTIPGGKFWYQLSRHLPVLDITQGHYHVLVPPMFSIYNQSHLIDAYIPVSNNMVEEIGISASQLKNWSVLLNALLPQHNKAEGFQAKKTVFIDALKQELVNLFGNTLDFEENPNQPIRKILKQQNLLPIRKKSPLMQYSLNHLHQLKKCEFKCIIEWVISKHKILGMILANSDISPISSIINYRSLCQTISKKDRTEPDIRAEQLGPDKRYRYDHNLKGQTIYLIPTEFLP